MRAACQGEVPCRRATGHRLAGWPRPPDHNRACPPLAPGDGAQGEVLGCWRMGCLAPDPTATASRPVSRRVRAGCFSNRGLPSPRFGDSSKGTRAALSISPVIALLLQGREPSPSSAAHPQAPVPRGRAGLRCYCVIRRMPRCFATKSSHARINPCFIGYSWAQRACAASLKD